MGRAPCCEKIGLKKGPWTPEEDQKLIAFIQRYSHGNWRALPKKAGLLRCGKSCRLRWTNYLRPDIKRGNFSKEEEEYIIKLHEILGNRWSAIAARLPGRTDNEIKNVWHTHLKKRLKQNQSTPAETKPDYSIQTISEYQFNTIKESELMKFPTQPNIGNPVFVAESPEQASSEFSSSVSIESSLVATVENHGMGIKDDDKHIDSLENFPEIDENFWSAVENFNMQWDFQATMADDPLVLQSPSSQVYMTHDDSNVVDNSGDFWYNLYVKAGELQQSW